MRYLLTSALIFLSDNFIKSVREKDKQEKRLLNGQVNIMTYHNHGAFLNALEHKPELVAKISAAFTAVLSVLFILTLGFGSKRMLKLGLAFLLGGAFSNTYDRFKRKYVVDYLNFPKAPGKIKNIVFNISDFFILIGAAFSVLAFQILPLTGKK